MNDILNLIIGFVGGVATTAGSYFTYQQYRQSKPSIELVDSSGSGLLSPEAEDKGYTWYFRFGLQNRKNVEYAITDILWTPTTRKLRNQIPHHEKGWQALIFDGVLERTAGSHRRPLGFKPYEFKTLEAHWNDYFVSNPHSDSAREYWEQNPVESKKFKAVMERLHKRKILFKLVLRMVRLGYSRLNKTPNPYTSNNQISIDDYRIKSDNDKGKGPILYCSHILST